MKSLLTLLAVLLTTFSVSAADYEFPKMDIILIDKTTKKPINAKVLVRPMYKYRCLNHAITILTAGEECHKSREVDENNWIESKSGLIASEQKNLKKEHLLGYSPFLNLQVDGISCKGQEWSPSNCTINLPLDILESHQGTLTIEIEGPNPELMSKNALEDAFMVMFNLDNPCHLNCTQKTSLHAIDPKNEADIKKMPHCSDETLKLFNAKADPKQGPLMAENLQKCFMVENVKCMKSCEGSKEISQNKDKIFTVDPNHNVVPSRTLSK